MREWPSVGSLALRTGPEDVLEEVSEARNEVSVA